jgi:hypothetical protein
MNEKEYQEWRAKMKDNPLMEDMIEILDEYNVTYTNLGEKGFLFSAVEKKKNSEEYAAYLDEWLLANYGEEY